MSGLDDIAVDALALAKSVASKKGVDATDTALMLKLAGEIAQAAVEVFDGHAKQHAAAAGVAAAATITTLEQAEEAEKKP